MGTEQDIRLANEIFAFARMECSVASNVVTRGSYSWEETKLLQYLMTRCQDLGLRVDFDGAGNLWIGQDGWVPRDVVVIGSHVDSVPNGGNYDGLAGVVAGLLVVKGMPRVRVVALRGEESAWFGQAYKGSKALFGKLDIDTHALCDAMKQQGIKTANLSMKKPLLDSKEIRAFLELHIEQGPVLDKSQRSLAAVTAIRGNVRQAWTCYGEAGHTGTTPWAARKDALVAVANLIKSLVDECTQQNSGYKRPKDLVFTAPSVVVVNPSSTTIPHEVQFSLEWRSTDRKVLNLFGNKVVLAMNRLHFANGFRFEKIGESRSAPARMSPKIVKMIERETGFTMPSGAGHDAAVFAGEKIPTGMVFVRNKGGSHNPNEHMDMVDFMRGVAVLRSVAAQLVR